MCATSAHLFIPSTEEENITSVTHNQGTGGSSKRTSPDNLLNRIRLTQKFRGVPLGRNSPNAVNATADCLCESVPAPNKLRTRTIAAGRYGERPLTD